MARGGRESELRVGGLKLWARFALSMTLSLAAVMAVASLMLAKSAQNLTESYREQTLVDAVRVTGTELRPGNYEQVGEKGTTLAGGEVTRFDVRYGTEGGAGRPGHIYQARKDGQVEMQLLVPQDGGRTGRGMLELIVGIALLVVVVGALVSVIVANQVGKPLEEIVDDIRQIARGDLWHRTHVRVGGELALLARTVDRMAGSLQEAQDAQVELSVREREMAVAGEVREALLPEDTPEVPGHDLGGLHVGCPQPGGDFHDFIVLDDGRVGLLVCDVSGQGVPGALVGATARSYLRSELARGTDVAESFRRVNRYLARDVRRGMYVTAMYVLLDHAEGVADVVCAGHKVPLVRFCAEDARLRLVQPEGIALGFDGGPVFDRALEVAKVPLAPGDRLVLANTGPVVVTDPDGNELGEKAFYKLILRHAAEDTRTLLRHLEVSLEKYADEEPFPNDISIVTVRREA